MPVSLSPHYAGQHLSRRRQRSKRSLEQLTMMHQFLPTKRQLAFLLRYHCCFLPHKTLFSFRYQNSVHVCNCHDTDWSGGSCCSLRSGFCFWRFSSIGKVCMLLNQIINYWNSLFLHLGLLLHNYSYFI